MLLHPRSKGNLTLKSRSPFHHPILNANFFFDPRDIDTILDGIRETIKIIEQPPFQELGVRLYNATVPGCEHTEFNSDDYWRCYIRHLSATLHHQVATCKMGPRTDETAVTDANARVHGFRNLRVADVSILPESPSGHTAAFSFLIGEKIADKIRNDWLPKESNIQRLTRARKSIDWLYQDPEHTTEAKPIVTTTTKRQTFNQQFTTNAPKPMNAEILNALHSLNMSGLSENSNQFRNSLVGDVSIILWGSPLATKPIDFKTKLAEHTNSTTNRNETNSEPMRRILKPSTSKVSFDRKPMAKTNSNEKLIESIVGKEETASTTDDDTSDKAIEVLTSSSTSISMSIATSNPIESTSIEDDPKNVTTSVETNTKMSNMDRIMATAPSLDEDAVKTYELNDNDNDKHQNINVNDDMRAKQLKLTKSTSLSEADATSALNEQSTVESTSVETSTEIVMGLSTVTANMEASMVPIIDSTIDSTTVRNESTTAFLNESNESTTKTAQVVRNIQIVKQKPK